MTSISQIKFNPVHVTLDISCLEAPKIQVFFIARFEVSPKEMCPVISEKLRLNIRGISTELISHHGNTLSVKVNLLLCLTKYHTM